jgi:hypothetical protein
MAAIALTSGVVAGRAWIQRASSGAPTSSRPIPAVLILLVGVAILGVKQGALGTPPSPCPECGPPDFEVVDAHITFTQTGSGDPPFTAKGTAHYRPFSSNRSGGLRQADIEPTSLMLQQDGGPLLFHIATLRLDEIWVLPQTDDGVGKIALCSPGCPSVSVDVVGLSSGSFAQAEAGAPATNDYGDRETASWAADLTVHPGPIQFSYVTPLAVRLKPLLSWRSTR